MIVTLQALSKHLFKKSNPQVERGHRGGSGNTGGPGGSGGTDGSG